MDTGNQYRLADNCQLGEIDGYGYAFVPGGSAGVVLLDHKSKEILERLSPGEEIEDSDRLDLFIRNGLVEIRIDPIKRIYPKIKTSKSFSVWLHVTNKCNLNCPYCYITDKDNYQMTFETLNAFLDKLEQTVKVHNLESVLIRIGGGEPTLHKKLIRCLVSKVKKRFIDKGIFVQLVLLTNGTVINNSWLNFLLANNIRLCVSLDGVGSWNDNLRHFCNGNGSFELIRRGLTLAVEKGNNPRILTTITEENIGGITLLNRFIIDSNLPFRYGVFRDFVGGYGAYERFVARLKEVLEECYGYYAEMIRKRGILFAHQFSDIHIDKRRHIRSCGIGMSSATIDHLGRIFLCQAKMDKDPLGTIWDKETLLEIIVAQTTLPELDGKTVYDYDGCEDCPWAPICGGGCPVVNANAKDSAVMASPYCDLFKYIIPKLVELKALSSINKYKKILERR